MPLANNRKFIRKTFKAILSGGISEVQKVISGQVDDFKGQSPIIVLDSAGSTRTPIAVGSSYPDHKIDLFTFVLCSDPENGWTEENAEDQLDDIECKIGDLIDANQQSAYWNAISYVQPSEAITVTIGGVDYRREVTTLSFM